MNSNNEKRLGNLDKEELEKAGNFTYTNTKPNTHSLSNKTKTTPTIGEPSTTEERDAQRINFEQYEAMNYAFNYGDNYGDTEMVPMTEKLEKKYYELMIKVTGMDWRTQDENGNLVPNLEIDTTRVHTLSYEPNSNELDTDVEITEQLEPYDPKQLKPYDPKTDISKNKKKMDALISELSDSPSLFGQNENNSDGGK